MFQQHNLNQYNAFRAIPNVPDFSLDQKSIKYTPEYEPLRQALLKGVKSMPANRRSYVRKSAPKPCFDRLAFPTPKGYTTFLDPHYYHFMVDLYQQFKAIGLDEPRLLVNHALLYTQIPEFFPNPDFQTSLPDVERYAPFFHAFWRFVRSRANIDEIKILAHKTTSPGFPMETVDKQPVKRADVIYGFRDSDPLPLKHMRSDYSAIKKGFMKLLPMIFERQRALVTEGIHPGNICELSADLILTNNLNGYRFNSIDRPVNVESYSEGKVLYGKNRSFVSLRADDVVFGTFDVKAYAQWLFSKGYNPSGFAPQRLRPINASTFVTNIPLQLDARLFLQQIEIGPSGFLSDNEDIRVGYQQFLERTGGMRRLFVTGDRSNSEMFITSNWDSLSKLIPDEHRQLMNVQLTHVKWGPSGPYIVRGCLSGIGWTTGLNVIVGLYEMAHTLAALLSNKIEDVAPLLLDCFALHKPFFEIDGFIVSPFLPTDDMPFVIAGDISRLNVDAMLKHAEERKMSIDTSYDGFVTFGMQVSNDGVCVASISFLSKLFYLENPGYFAKDCFSISQRLRLMHNRELVDRLLVKHFGFSSDFYDLQGGQFLRDLSRYGISVDEAFNTYSPKDRLLLGVFASTDPIFGGQDVTDDTCKRILRSYLAEAPIVKEI